MTPTLAEVDAALDVISAFRYAPLEDLLEVDDDALLERAVRKLRAGAYSAGQAAEKILRFFSHRCTLCAKDLAAGGSDACEACIAEADRIADEART